MVTEGKPNLPSGSSETFLAFLVGESDPYPMETKGQRIRHIREDVLKEDQGQFGRRFGVTNKAVSQWESDTTQPTPKRLAEIAALGGKSIDWMELGSGLNSREIHIVGRVGAGAEIFAFDDEAMGGGEPLEAPHDVGRDAVAVTIEGDSMFPDLDDGDVVVYDTRYESDFDAFLNKRVVIGIPDGRRYIKRLKRGSEPGLWTLRSSNPAVHDIEDVEVEWIAPIKWIRPR